MSSADDIVDLEPREAGDAGGVLRPGPEMTIVHAADLREQFLRAVQSGREPLVLDLGEVAEIDSSAVQLVLALQRSLREQGRTLQVQAISRPVRDLWQLFGLPALDHPA